MESGYFGGILDRDAAGRLRLSEGSWHWAGRDVEVFLHASGPCCRLFEFGAQALLFRGPIVDTASLCPRDLELLADKLLTRYLAQGKLVLDSLEGSFTVALLDGEAGRLLLYRNLVGAGFTYYHESRGGLLFGSNLAALVDATGESPRPNEADLPTFFLNRSVPGRNTLFAGFHRLMPGEQLRFEEGRGSLTQRRTFADLREDRELDHDALDRLEETTSRVCADYAALAPDAANLLSGGVDSSFLQLHWNRACPRPPALHRSFCVGLDHARTRCEMDYACSAAKVLGTEHTIVPVDAPYAGYLFDVLASTGEVPGHVQLVYFQHLARAMVAGGVTAALSGEAADSLFGLATANKLQNAALLRTLCPTSFLRRGGAALSGLLGWERLRGYFYLADRLYDMEWLAHPVNQVTVWADWPSVEACFGRDAVEGIAARRRELLDEYRIPETPLLRSHAAAFLSSSTNAASLTVNLFAREGAILFCPFLDSRVLRVVMSLAPRQRFRFRRPKSLLKRSLARHGHADLAYRQKLSFGQPIFEWLAPSGQLGTLVGQIDHYDFLDARTVAAAKAKPNWFLFSLLCYDLWHKMYIARTLPRSPAALTEHLAAIG